MKDYLKKIICIMLAASIGFFLLGCSKDTDEDSADVSPEESTEITMDDIMEAEESDTEDYDNGIFFEEEMDGETVEVQKKSSEDFIGSWEATSGQAKYQYGNVDIDIAAGGTWTGNISDEDLKGSWKEDGNGISLTSSLFSCTLAFTKDGVLVMQYDPDESGEVITTVLTKK